MTLIFITLAWLLGLLAGETLGLPRSAAPYLAVAAGTAALLAWRVRGARQAGAVWAAALLGCARCLVAYPLLDVDALARLNGTGAVQVRGWVVAPPDVRATATYLTVEALGVGEAGAAGERPAHGRLLLTVPRYPEYAYGDLLSIEGPVEAPPRLTAFDYPRYLARRGILSVSRGAHVTRLGVQPGTGLRRAAEALRLRLRGRIERLLPEPEAGLLSGILLGYEHTLATEVDEAFRRAGLTHVLVISGSNIGLVMQMLLVTGRLVGRRRSLWLAALGAVAYALFVGWAPPVARAALMGALYAGAPLAGRRHHGPTSLAAATLVMTAHRPLELWGPSLQLSLAATGGLLLLEPALARALRAWAERRGGRGLALWRVGRALLLMTLVAQAATLPVLWYHFGEVSAAALLANLLALPVQAAIIPLGALALAGSLLSPALGQALGWGVWLPLRWTALVSEWVARAPEADLALPPLSLAGAAALYGLLGALALVLSRRAAPPSAAPPASARRQIGVAPAGRGQRARVLPGWLLGGLGGVAALVWVAVATLPDGRLHLYALDVGQGDALLIRAPGGRTVLVDGGPDPLLCATRLGRALPFWQRRLDLVVATHADADHLAGLVGVVERHQVGAALEAPGMGAGALVERWYVALEAQGAPVVPAVAGLEVRLGEGVALSVLHPAPGGAPAPGTDENATSVVLRVTYGDFTALLTADVDAATEGRLREAGAPLEATVLKVAHHGAAASTTAAFLTAVRSREALVSVGRDNDFGHPSPEVLGRLAAAGARVWRTDACGTVHVATDGVRYWIAGSRAAAGVPSP